MDGLVIIDKPEGPTSHGVVGKVRRILGTRKVGHAGTLDPMATGMLVLGVGRATRLLGYFTASEKEYVAVMRFGISTFTDDAQGDVTATQSAGNLDEHELLEVLRDFRGPIKQRPSQISAIKVDGKRAYALARAGEEVDLPERDVIIHDLEIINIVHDHELDVTDVKVRVVCSAGTYIRALARDLGARLGVGAHLISLRRTRSGVFNEMITLEQLEANPQVIPLADVVRKAFPIVTLNDDDANKAIHGVRIPAPIDAHSGVAGIFREDGSVISLAEITNSEVHPLVVFV